MATLVHSYDYVFKTFWNILCSKTFQNFSVDRCNMAANIASEKITFCTNWQIILKQQKISFWNFRCEITYTYLLNAEQFVVMAVILGLLCPILRRMGLFQRISWKRGAIHFDIVYSSEVIYFTKAVPSISLAVPALCIVIMVCKCNDNKWFNKWFV